VLIVLLSRKLIDSGYEINTTTIDRSAKVWIRNLPVLVVRMFSFIGVKVCL